MLLNKKGTDLLQKLLREVTQMVNQRYSRYRNWDRKLALRRAFLSVEQGSQKCLSKFQEESAFDSPELLESPDPEHNQRIWPQLPYCLLQGYS